MSIHTNDKRLGGLAVIFFRRRSKESMWIAAICPGSDALKTGCLEAENEILQYQMFGGGAESNWSQIL